ncbi:hypothetical protein LP414_27790 [Polaromonas sp. P1(28)-13]|nr:hypothetical protein LP414_27790 [Polaromonas sp. P1(28)-13]
MDTDGNTLSVSSVQYRVTDSLGDEVIALTSLAGFVALTPDAVIVIPAASNTFIGGLTRDLRHVELRCMIGLNIVTLTVDYIIESGDQLEIGVNSFQSLAQAQFNAALIPNLTGWSSASSSQQIAALIDARLHICQLNFSPLTGNKLWGQDSLNFVPEGSYPTNYAQRQGGFLWGGNLTFVNPEQFAKLPDLFRKALNRAQIVEADAILGGDPVEEKRHAGLLLDTVGESKQMYRAGKPLDLPVCRRALSYLSMFVSFSKVIARQ